MSFFIKKEDLEDKIIYCYRNYYIAFWFCFVCIFFFPRFYWVGVIGYLIVLFESHQSRKEVKEYLKDKGAKVYGSKIALWNPLIVEVEKNK